MDPVSHAAFGVTLVRTLRSDPARGASSARAAVLAATLGALSPDIDIVVMPFGWDRYLRVHEIGTHSIVGAIVCGMLTGALVWIFKGAATGQRRREYLILAVYASIAALSHVLLDLLSSARVKPGWPFVDTVVSFPVVAMADPWMLALCVGGAVALRFSSDRRRAAFAAIGAIAVFAVVKGALGALAVAGYKNAAERSGEPVLARVVEAEWASLTRYRVFDRTTHSLRAWRARASGDAELTFTVPLEPETPLVATLRQWETVDNLLSVHSLAFPVTVANTGVLWSDIRFCWHPPDSETAIVEPVVQSGEGTRLECALWLGGETSNGQLVTQIVKVGSHTQVR